MCNKAAPKSIVEMGKKRFALVFLLPILDVVLCKEGGCQTIISSLHGGCFHLVPFQVGIDFLCSRI